MANEWAAVDDLMRELGSIRRAAADVDVSAHMTIVIDRAITDAAEAVELTIDTPTNPAKLMTARDALGVAEEVILALDAEVGRSLRVRARAGHLRARATALIERAVELERRRSQ
jgi:hypothetical protein